VRAPEPAADLRQRLGLRHHGPEASRAGYDLIAQGEGGVMSLTGEPDGTPMKAGVSQADIVAGMWT
jgi:crotonobetainyl-CoA:carnitine CoA-transferase CaiB-like acyl-CoA transferase